MSELYPPSIHEQRLYPERDVVAFGPGSKAVVSRFLRKARSLGYEYRSDLSSDTRRIYQKGSTALVVVRVGSPIIRGQGGARPHGMLVSELKTAWSRHLKVEAS